MAGTEAAEQGCLWGEVVVGRTRLIAAWGLLSIAAPVAFADDAQRQSEQKGATASTQASADESVPAVRVLSNVPLDHGRVLTIGEVTLLPPPVEGRSVEADADTSRVEEPEDVSELPTK